MNLDQVAVAHSNTESFACSSASSGMPAEASTLIQAFQLVNQTSVNTSDDIKSFCIENNKDGRYKNFESGDIKSNDDLDKVLTQAVDNGGYLFADPWIYAVYPSLNARLLGYRRQLSIVCENQKTLLAMSVISSGAAILDSMTLDSHHPYSYPPKVETTCDFGKPYHFWMSAYLSRKMAREIGDKNAAIYATFLSELGYQMRATYADRDPLKAFATPTMSPENNRLRMDLAYAAAGSVYGANPDGPVISVDSTLGEIIRNAKPQETLNREQAAALWNTMGGVNGYMHWKEILAPDSGLSFLMK